MKEQEDLEVNKTPAMRDEKSNHMHSQKYDLSEINSLIEEAN